jgi:hypothetical protein
MPGSPARSWRMNLYRFFLLLAFLLPERSRTIVENTGLRHPRSFT